MNGLTKALLIALGTGAVITLAIAFPGAGWVYKEFKKEQWEEAKKRGRLRSTIKRLEKQELVSWSEQNGETKLTLTDKGKQKILQYKFDDLEIKIPSKWDGWWRIVIFDVPEENRLARDMFREKLKDLNFYQLQESVFIFPHECKNEVDFLKHTFGVAPYVQFIKAKEIDGIDYKKFGV